MVCDKGYHSDATMVGMKRAGVRSYVSEPERGRRRWKGKSEAQRAVYGNRRRMRGRHGRRLMRRRGEKVERSFAHVYDTGGMWRLHLRCRENITKRLLIHAAGFNLALLMRHQCGIGKPRSLQNRVPTGFFAFVLLVTYPFHPPERLRAIVGTFGPVFRFRRDIRRPLPFPFVRRRGAGAEPHDPVFPQAVSVCSGQPCAFRPRANATSVSPKGVPLKLY